MRMILHKKQAFSLTELLIVLVVIAILFAAMAPIVTKRRMVLILQTRVFGIM